MQDALRAATPNIKLSEPAIWAGLEKVVVGKTTLNIRWRDAQTSETPTLNICVPWSPTPTRRRREILQGHGAPASELRPMRMEARRAFALAYGRARHWLDLLTEDPQATIADIADREHRTERSIRQTLSMAFLDPALVTAALAGRLPRGFGLTRLMGLPTVWTEQWIAIGVCPSLHR